MNESEKKIKKGLLKCKCKKKILNIHYFKLNGSFYCSKDCFDKVRR